MPRLLVGERWQLRIACYTASQVAINVINYEVISITALGAPDLAAADELDNNFDGLYKDLLSAGARYRGVSLQRRNPGPPTRPAVSTSRDAAGFVAGDILPGQVSGIITATTDFAGRAFRGRWYIPFPSETSSDADGKPTVGYVLNLGVLRLAMTTPKTVGDGSGTSTLVPTVFHRETNTSNIITGGIERQRWATQRRRGHYGALNPQPF